MDITIIIFISFVASILTFFSGFGLGTLMTPVFFMLFRDLPLAIGATAIVHIANNLFKFGLMRKSINWHVGWKFAFTALLGSIGGAFILGSISNVSLWEIEQVNIEIKALNLILGLTLIVFTMLELIESQWLKRNPPGPAVGGAITGLMAGLTGHQGALRSAFLMKYGFSKDTFIATGIFIALVTDAGRIPVYLSRLAAVELGNYYVEITLAIIAAILGALIGKYLLKKMTLVWLNRAVSIMIIVFSVALIAGWI